MLGLVFGFMLLLNEEADAILVVFGVLFKSIIFPVSVVFW